VRPLSVDTLLISPIQRVPRYTLLLQSLSALSPPWHPDAAYISRAHAAALSLALSLNEDKRAADATAALAAAVVGFPSLRDGGRLRKEGELFEWRGKERKMLLFDRVLLECRPLASGQLKVKRSLALTQLTRLEDLPDANLLLNALSVDGVVYAAAEAKGKVDWLDHLRTAISDAASLK
jgi:hypothetical protein